ncbi:MAG: HD domain-containing protein [Sphaerochaetaceae bacterium]|jgi:predicted hydrolase (HD superfamily)|nr:HD domain-containing protein [Sphaerochaetaceae bacterium]NLO60132.1 HD domain-containing protein [Spirochaetales bacterium]MDD2406781.1 HD domain-containing protein [Sphaerochaetaceae bacterium]MDD3670991.1 HD domain-containing protein [Sphaerochaetaceae bacterium]MDD4259503.1 HD domain-containing protein [Sphaerochaetaceae bacterium]
MKTISREEAIALYKQYNDSESLFRHALSVEAVMRRFAVELHENPEFWAIVGILHDIDYGLYPAEHLKHAPRMLEDAGISSDVIHAVVSHGWGICSEVEPVHIMEKVLYTIDELTGLVTATALMRPSKSVMDLSVSSVKKKWKTKGFSAGVDRDLIAKGAILLNMELDKVIELTIDGMRSVAKEIGLG